MRCIVHAPDYTGRSGGVRALYRFARELTCKGVETAVASLGPTPWTSSECPYPIVPAYRWNASQRAEAVHVYPEIVQGNPAHADRVVRWLLGPRRYETDDLEFGWIPSFDVPVLNVDIIEAEHFYPKLQPGSGYVVWRGKSSLTIWPGKEITFDWPSNREELGDVLRAADLVVSFDPFSALTLEATVCGTPVLIPDSIEPVESPRFGRLGIAWGVSELEQARAEVHESAAHYQQLRVDFAGDIDRFIERTSAHFGG